MRPNTTTAERLAILETQADQMIENAARREETQAEILDDVKALSALMHEFRDEMTRYKGMFGGALFIVSGVGMFLAKFGHAIVLWVQGLKVT